MLSGFAISSSAAFDCSPGPYIVFFDADSARLDSDAVQVLDDARRNAGGCGSLGVFLAGHTDTGERPAWARARLATVRAYLTKHGVRKRLIRTKAFGAKRLRAVTGQNVSERQNRRVELVYGSIRN